MKSIEHKGANRLTVYCGRDLQQAFLKALKGSDIEAGQKALIARCQANSESSKGDYIAGSQPSSQDTLFEAGYKY